MHDTPAPHGAPFAPPDDVNSLHQRLAVLDAVNHEITHERNLQVLLPFIAEQIALLLHTTVAGIVLWNPATEMLEIGALYGPLSWLWAARLRLGEGLTGAAAQQRRGLRVDDYQTYANAMPAFQARFGHASMAAEPVLYHDRLLGAITVGRRGPVQPFTDTDQALLAHFASQVAMALEHARLLQESQQHEARYRALVEGSVQGLSIFDQQGQRVFANTAMAHMLGYESAEELLGQHVLEGVVPEDMERLQQYHAQRRQGQEAPSRYEYRRLKKDGTPIWVEHTITPITWEGQPAHLVTSMDITRRVDLEEQIEQYLTQLEMLVAARAQRIKELERQRLAMEKLAATAQIAAGVAHEINNPLAGMKNALFLIKSALPPQHESVAYIDLIEHEITHLSTIVRQMYDIYSPIAAPPQPCCLSMILLEVCARWSPQSQGHQVTLRWEIPADLPPLLLVESYLRQVLSNLINNALQASPPQTEVLITAQYDGTHLSIQVTDHGPGIAPEHLPRLFEPFFTTKRSGEQTGMGLGLSISQTLAAVMGGQLEVTTALGQGSTFTLVIPCPVASAAPESLSQ